MDIVGSLRNAKINDDKVEKKKIKRKRTFARCSFGVQAFLSGDLVGFGFFLLLLINCVVSRLEDIYFRRRKKHIFSFKFRRKKGF